MNKTYKNNDIIHTKNIIKDLSKILKKYKGKNILILTDDICKKKCYPIIKESFNEETYILEIEHGEQNKTIESITKIWDFLIFHKFNRNSLILNLGGGVLSDIGGFSASTFKRGIPFINIPTTLLAQIDASVGGKTGFNYQGLKNEIGVFSLPEKVLISPIFLKTLDEKEFLSGFAEMIKHALIADPKHLKELKSYISSYLKEKNFDRLLPLIKKSVKIKEEIIKKDIKDEHIRKILNFGHTFGHAFESYFNKPSIQVIKHGEAVAFGMICELFISTKKLGLNEKIQSEIAEFLISIFGTISIPDEDFKIIFNLMKHDKKNINSDINCILIKAVGKPSFDKKIVENEIMESLDFFNKLHKKNK